MNPLTWALILLLVGFGLAILEVFIPSGGALGVLSLLAMLVALGIAFDHSAWTGLGFMGAAALAVPLLIYAAISVWPKTWLGRRMLPPVPTDADVLPDIAERQVLKELIGQVGRAKSFMLPSGPVVIAGRTYDALSEGMAIDPGQAVRVIAVRGTRIVVRPHDDSIASAPPRPAAAEPSENPLDRPIESLGIDPFDEPLA